MIARLARALRGQPPAPPPTNGGGLDFGALYPQLPPPGMAARTYAPVRWVASSTASVVLAEPNPARRLLSVVNDGTANLYLALAGYASTSSWTVKLLPGATFAIESPDPYTGPVAAVWDAVSGSARVTETT